MIKVGDRVVVYGLPQKAIVERVWYDTSSSATVIELDWGEFGHSRVYDYDENKTWYKYHNTN